MSQNKSSEKRPKKAPHVTDEELLKAIEGAYTTPAMIARMALEVFRLRAKLRLMRAKFMLSGVLQAQARGQLIVSKQANENAKEPDEP